MTGIHRRRLALISLAIVGAAAVQPVFVAKGDVMYAGGNYTQNFDSLFNPTTTGFNDTYNVGSGTSQTWTDNQASAPPASDGIDGWYASEPGPPALTGAGFIYNVSDGVPKSKGTLSGGVYDFGSSVTLPGSGLVSDRALGVVGTSTSGTTTIGVKLVNTTSTTFTQLSIGYMGEEWFSGSNSIQKSLTFKYGIFDAGAGSTVTSAGSTDSALNFIAPVVSADPNTGAALDGNSAANRQSLSSTEQGASVVWAPGQVLWLTWQIGADAKGGGLAIDDLTFSAGQTPARSITWNAGNTTWSTSASNTNWLNGAASTFYLDGDFIGFGDTGVGAVTISGNVTPGSLSVTNTSGTYTFSGGSINGGTSLVKTGAGTLILNNANGYTGGTSVDAGTLVINNDNNLGATGTGITLTGGATLRTAAGITANRTVTVGAGGATLDTNGTDSSFASLASTGGALTKIGAGNLTVGSISFAGNGLSVNSGNLIITATGGTSSFNASGSFSGNIVLQGVTRLSINGGTVGGGGTIFMNAAGAVLASAGTNQNTDIQNNIVINAVQAHIGASTTDTLTVDGIISGNADVYYTNDLVNGGKGIVILNNQNTYTGQSVIDFGDAGVVRLGVSNALPTHTALSFGDGVNTSNIGALDLNGFDQTVASLASNLPNGNKATNPQITYGIVDTGFNSAPNVLTIVGSANTTYAGTIGIPPAFPVGTTSQIGGEHVANIILALGAGNTGTLTLTGNNSYTGGTILNGGTLSVSSDANLGDASGAVTFGGGTLEITGAGFASNRTIAVGAGGGTVSVDNAAGALAINGVVTVTGTLAKAGAGMLTVGGLSVTGGVNLIGGQIVVEDTSANRANDLAILKNQALAGNTGNNTVGIYSTTAAAAHEVVVVSDNAVRLSAFGAAASSFGGGTNNVDANSILITTAMIGDANLDGVVDIKDLQDLANHWQQPATDWSQGDFDGNGIVALQDLQAIANHWQAGVGSGGGQSFGEALALLPQFGGTSSVPEPMSLAMVGLGGMLLLARRKCR